MKIKFLILAVLLVTITSCTKNKYNLTVADKAYLNKTVDSIFDLDQNVRLHFNTIDKKYNVNKNTFSKTEDFKRRYLDSLTYPIYQKSIDSVWSILKINDSLNTKLLIDLTKDYGFPNNRRLGVQRSKAYMIFTHTANYYKKEVEGLVNKEHEAGRMIEYKKEYILWHIRGRNGLPPASSPKGKAIWQKPLDRENK